MKSLIQKLSLNGRLRLIAAASILLMLGYVGANLVVGTMAARVDTETRRATETLILASSLEKDLTSLLRDTYLMAAAPTPDRIDAALGNMADFKTALSETEAAEMSPAHRRALGEVRSRVDALDALITASSRTIASMTPSQVEQFMDELAVFDDVMDTQIEVVRDGERAALSEARSAQDRTAAITRWVGIVALVLTIIGVLATTQLIGGAITASIDEIQALVRALAEGRRDLEVPQARRSDVFGALGRSISALQSALSEADDLRAQQDADTQRRLARQQEVEDAVVRFEASSTELLNSVMAASQQLSGSASQMQSSSSEASSLSRTAHDAAGNAASGIQAVAAASEELAASIREVSEQVTRTSELSGEASVETETSANVVAQLSEAAQAIGEIVTLIETIADQTNLLALNATIEAARAGEAGKGFAVVASEVKELAEQTSNATQQISAQIQAIQSASEKTAASTGRTLDAVRQLGELATSCAAAIDQQRVATTEIAEAAQRADAGASEASSGVSQVVTFTQQTDEISKSVLAAAEEMSRRHESWKSEFETFVKTMRSA